MPENYDLMLLALSALLVVLGLILLLRFFARRRAGRPVYEAAPQFLSDPERALLAALEQALDDDYRVFCLVRLAELVRVRSRLGKGRRQTAQQAIDQERVGFVICRKDDLSVAGVVEVDDPGRPGADRKQRDALIGKALEQSAIPLVRVPAQGAYGVGELKGRLNPVLEPAAASIRTPRAAGGDEWQLGQKLPSLVQEPEDWFLDEDLKSAKPAPQPVKTQPELAQKNSSLEPVVPAAGSRPRCPACGSEMVRRRVTEGKNAGTIFWGCAGFPGCRKVLPIERIQSEKH